MLTISALATPAILPAVRRMWRWLAVLLVGVSLGCANGSTDPGQIPPPPPPPAPPPPPPPPGNSFTLTPSAASPNARVVVGGLAPGLSLTGIHARVIAAAPSGADTTAALVARDSLGAVIMVVPMHPAVASGTATGAVQVEFTGPGAPAGQAAFTIQPLPPASKTVVEQVDLLKAMATKWFEKMGTSRAELRALSPNNVPVEIFPLWMAQHLIDDPTNPNSLEKIAQGSAPNFPLDPLNRDVLARILSAADLQSLYTHQSAVLDGLPTLRTNVSGPAAARPRLFNPAGMSCIPAGSYGIDDGVKLNGAMQTSRSAQAFTGGLTGRVYGDIGTAVGALGVIPQLKAGSAVVGGLMYTYNLLNLAAGALLPSAFKDNATTFMLVSKETFFEDDTEGGWRDFEVTATSTGWGLDGEILNALAQVSGFVDLGGLTAIPGMSEVKANLREFVVNTVVAAAIGATTSGQSFLEVCPGTWSNIPLAFDPWLTVEQPNGTSIELVGNHSFNIKEAGISEIRVATKPEHFGGAQAIKTKPVEVAEIAVNVVPDLIQLEVSTVATFTAEVEHANDERVRWIVPSGLQVISPGGLFSSSITIKTPDDPWNTPFTLRARSISEEGARAGKSESDPRDGFAAILGTTQVVVIAPPPTCIEQGETFQFTAQAFGFPGTPEIRWSKSAGGGTIDPVSGLYTAPQTAGSGNVTIVAEVVGQSGVTDEVAVGVGCACNYTFRLGSEQIVAETGDRLVFNSSNGRLIGISITRPSRSWNLNMLPISSTDQSLWPNAPGSWPIRVQGDMGLTDPADFLFSSDDNAPPSMNLQSYVPGVELRGSVAGLVKVVTTGPPSEPTFDWSFSIRYAPGEFFCTVGP